MAGVIHALLAAIGFAAFQTVNHRAIAGVDVFRGTSVLVCVGTVVLGLVTVTTQDLSLLRTAPLPAFGFAAVAGFVHFFGGWVLLGTSQRRVGVARTGVLVGTAPLFGAIVAATVLGERLTPVVLVGLLLVVGGVAIVMSARDRSAVQGTKAVPGVLAGLGTALCWSISPVLIRRALEGIPSPVMVATIGMAACAAIAIAVLISRWHVRAPRVSRHTSGLLMLAGTLIALAIWMHWNALALTSVATALSLLQLTPPLVVLTAMWTSGRSDLALGRIWAGTGVTVLGSLVVVLAS